MASVCGALVAGGVFFLDWLPIAQGTWLQLASQGLLEWPAILLGPAWMQFPLWLSSLLPLLATFVLGADQRTRPVALGITCGVGTHLLHGMVVGTLNPSWIPWGLDTLWLAGNATVCLLLALGLAGTDKLERGSGS